MLKVTKWFAIVLGVLVLAFILTGFLLPSTYAFERSITIQASPQQIHQFVGDLRRWQEWTPWALLEPSIQTTYGATTTGVGASQSWTSDSGGGELTLTRSDPLSGVDYRMSFDGAFPSDGSIRYEVTPEGTRVIWDMRGEADNFIGRYMGLLMESMVGPNYEAGLSTLKTLAESLPAVDPAPDMDPAPGEEPDAAEAVG
jgi:hypothetical protein